MADAEAEQEPARVRPSDGMVLGRDFSRRMRPDVDDAGGHHGAPGAPKQGHDVIGQAFVSSAREPDRAVAQLFELRRRIKYGLAVARPKGAAPHAESPQVHTLRLLPLPLGEGGGEGAIRASAFVVVRHPHPRYARPLPEGEAVSALRGWSSGRSGGSDGAAVSPTCAAASDV